MRNSKQDILTNIKIILSLLKYSDDDLIKMYNKNLKQISKLKCCEIKLIFKDLYRHYKNL